MPNAIVLGDFNIDYDGRFDVTYLRKDLFCDFDTTLGDLNLIQLIDFTTWSRVIRGQIKKSILDHVYVADPFKIKGIKGIRPIFGDHNEEKTRQCNKDHTRRGN